MLIKILKHLLKHHVLFCISDDAGHTNIIVGVTIGVLVPLCIILILVIVYLKRKCKCAFYCATIAYHVGLNALLVAARHRRPTLEKNKHAVGSAS